MRWCPAWWHLKHIQVNSNEQSQGWQKMRWIDGNGFMLWKSTSYSLHRQPYPGFSWPNQNNGEDALGIFFFLPQKMMLRRCATVSSGHFRPDYKGPKCIWVLRASHMRRIFRGPRPRDLNRRRHGGGGHTDWVGKPKVEEVQLFIWDVLGCPYQALATPQLRKRPLHLWCSHKFMSVQCVTQWSSHEKPTKHYMNLNQTHFPWTSCDRWRSRKWFEKGGHQRSFSAGGYLKTRHYVILCVSHNSGPLMLNNVLPTNDWIIFISHSFVKTIRSILESMILRIPFFSAACTFITYSHGLIPWLLVGQVFWAADILIRIVENTCLRKRIRLELNLLAHIQLGSLDPSANFHQCQDCWVGPWNSAVLFRFVTATRVVIKGWRLKQCHAESWASKLDAEK